MHILSIVRNKSPLQISGKVAGCVVRTLKTFQHPYIGRIARSSLRKLSCLVWIWRWKFPNRVDAFSGKIFRKEVNFPTGSNLGLPSIKPCHDATGVWRLSYHSYPRVWDRDYQKRNTVAYSTKPVRIIQIVHFVQFSFSCCMLSFHCWKVSPLWQWLRRQHLEYIRDNRQTVSF